MRTVAALTADVLVIGAGPGGLYAAGSLARAGHRVLVCEEHATIGDPVHCTGVVAAEAFDEFELPRRAVLNPLHRVCFVSPSGLEVSYATPRAEAVVVDRGAFDRGLADRARQAGAEIRTSARVRALTISADAAEATVGDQRVRARLVVLACGASYGWQRREGLGLPSQYLMTAQRELPASTLRDVEMHFGREIAPGGFAWAVPVSRPEGSYVRVGLMADGDVNRYFQRLLHRVRDRWGIAAGEVSPRLKILPLAPVGRTYGTRVLAVGDAAGLVKPTTGGGIYYSVVSAEMAATVGGRALSRDRLQEKDLAPYQAQWRARLAREFEAQQSMRRVAVAMSDAQIDEFFHLAQTDGVMPLVRKTAKFNEHRHLIAALFRHPPARRILFRAIAR